MADGERLLWHEEVWLSTALLRALRLGCPVSDLDVPSRVRVRGDEDLKVYTASFDNDGRVLAIYWLRNNVRGEVQRFEQLNRSKFVSVALEVINLDSL